MRGVAGFFQMGSGDMTLVACRRESITAVATPKNKKQVCAWRVQLFGRIFSPFHTNEFTATGH
jgi:hypothetical protein